MTVLKVKHNLTYNPAILFLGIYLREMKSYIYIITDKKVFVATLSVLAKTGNNPNVHPTEEWINKLRYIHTRDCYSAIKRNEFSREEPRWRRNRTGDHFLSYKFIKRITERRANFTKQLLIASSGH